jgi:hypothetical protein
MTYPFSLPLSLSSYLAYLLPVQGEYGSTAEVQGSHRNGRKSVMIAICAASMLLALAVREPEYED